MEKKKTTRPELSELGIDTDISAKMSKSDIRLIREIAKTDIIKHYLRYNLTACKLFLWCGVMVKSGVEVVVPPQFRKIVGFSLAGVEKLFTRFEEVGLLEKRSPASNYTDYSFVKGKDGKEIVLNQGYMDYAKKRLRGRK